MKWWSEHKALGREESMLEYLKIAQDLEMYGVSVGLRFYLPFRFRAAGCYYMCFDEVRFNSYLVFRNPEQERYRIVAGGRRTWSEYLRKER